MTTMVRLGVYMSAMVVLTIGVAGTVVADERVDVAVFDLMGQDIDEELLEILSGVLRQEAQQHSGFSLANAAQIQRDEIALVVGCNPDEVSCLRQMGEYVDGQVLVFGDVAQEEGELRIGVEVFDIAASEEAVRIERTVDSADDPVVAFRREVATIFGDLESIGETHLIVEAPQPDLVIHFDGAPVGHGRFEEQGIDTGTYRVVIGDAGEELWQDDVELEPGRLVEIRPDIEVEQEEEPSDEEVAEMQVEATTVVPGESRESSSRIQYDGGRSNVGAFSLMGVGTMSLAASGIMVMQMRSVERQIQQEHAQETLDEERHRELTRRGESYQAAQYVLLSVGAAGLTMGAGWAMWNYGRDRREERHLGSKLRVTPTKNGLSVFGRW